MRLLAFLFAFACVAAEPADWLISARYVITMDAERRVIDNGAVAVKQNRIIAVGTAAEINAKYQGKRVDAGEAILAPGFINTHTHAAMSLMRGIADDRSLQDWLENFIFPAEGKNVSPEFVRWGTLLACSEMVLSGTTTFTDMYYFEEVAAAATKDCGLRAVLGQTVIGFPVADAKDPTAALQRTEAFLKRYDGDALIVPAVAPHAIYTTPNEVLQQARALANKYKAPFLIHLAETRKEQQDALQQRGKSPTKTLLDLGLLEGRTLAAHAVWLDDADITILAEKKVGVAHCPSSNMKLASGAAPVIKLLEAGVAVGLGPDGPAGSNNDFDMLEEANLASNLQKVTSMNPQVLPAKQAAEMLTILGAQALEMDQEIGSLEVGKRADLVVLSLKLPRTQPVFDAYSQLIYASKGSDVQHVMVEGKWVVREGKLQTVKLPEVLAKAAEWRERISASVKK